MTVAWEVTQAPPLDPEDAEDLRVIRDMERVRGHEERNMVSTMLSTYEGRAFVSMILQAAGVDRSSFAGEETHATAYACGMRDLGLLAVQWVFTAAPETYSMLRKEAAQREKRYATLAGYHEPEEDEGT